VQTLDLNRKLTCRVDSLSLSLSLKIQRFVDKLMIPIAFIKQNQNINFGYHFRYEFNKGVYKQV
jgi:hypothetical protein